MPGQAMGTRLSPALLFQLRVVDGSGRPAGIPVPFRARVQRSLQAILDGNALCAMATVGPAMRAHINTAYFAYSRTLELFFLSHPRSQHVRNLARNSRVAIAVYSSRQRWNRPDRGVQIFGRCSEAMGSAAGRASRSYAKRYSDYRRWRATATGAEAEYRLYRVFPSVVKVFDERQLGDGAFVTARVRAGRRQLR